MQNSWYVRWKHMQPLQKGNCDGQSIVKLLERLEESNVGQTRNSLINRIKQEFADTLPKKRQKPKICPIWFLFSGVVKRVVFQKGGFGGCSNGTKTGTRVHSDVPPGTKTGTRVRSHVPPERKNRNEGTFAKTTPLGNRPFASSRCLFEPL